MATAGAATPVCVVTNRMVEAGHAIPVEVVCSGSVIGGEPLPVYPITAAQLRQNGGHYKLLGGEPLRVKIVNSRGITGGASIPAYAVSGNLIEPNILTYMVDWWTMDESSASADRIGTRNGIPLSAVNSPNSTPGVVSNAVFTDAGATKRYLVDYSADRDSFKSNGKSRALAYWQFIPTGQNSIIARDNDPTTPPFGSYGRDYEITFNPGGFITWYCQTEGIELFSSGPIFDAAARDVWQFIFASYDHSIGRLTLRLNNITQTKDITPFSGPIVNDGTSPPPFTIGRRSVGPVTSYFSTFKCDEFVLWIDYAPSSSEIDLLYNNGTPLGYQAYLEKLGICS